MKQSQMSIEEIRQYCIDNGLNFFDYITKQQDTSAIEKKERKSVKVKKVVDSLNRKNEYRQNIAFIYQVDAEGEPKRQESEVDEVKWFPKDALPKAKDFAFDHWEIVQDFLKI